MPLHNQLMTLSALILALNAAGASAQDSAETTTEQAAAIAAEINPRASTLPGQTFGGAAGPLLVGVDDAAVGAFRIDVVGDIATQAFTGAQVWGAAYDAANDRVLFNNGTELLEWPVGGAVNSLGDVTGPGMSLLTMTGLAFGDDTLYACRNIANEAIYSIDLNTLVATVFIDYDDASFDCGGLAFNPDDGMLYMTNDDATPFGSGLFRMNMDGTGTLITAYPPGETDIDGLAIGDGRAYLLIDEPGNLYVWDFGLAAYQTPLTSPFSTSEVFSGGTWIGGAGSAADMAVTLTDAPDPVNAGENLTYTVTATNNGPSDADNVSVTLPLPAGTSFVSATPDAGGSCNAASPVTCTWAGPTTNGASRVATIVAAVAGSTTGPLNATATVSSDTTDPNVDNDSASATTGVTVSADVGVTKVATSVPSPVLVGSSIIYQLTASNAGPANATGIVVTDTLPTQLDFVSNDCGASFAAPTLTWNVGALASGANAVCNLTVQVAETGAISNTASITSATSDPNSANNASTVVITGAEVTDMAITLTSNAPGGLTLGDGFVYTVTGTNNGPGTAAGIDFSLDLSPNVNFVSSNCGAALAGNTLSWSVASLANGASSDCQVTVLVALPGTIVATATVSSATFDSDLANNSAELVVSAEAVPVPTQSMLGLLLLAMMSLVIGMVALRRT